MRSLAVSSPRHSTALMNLNRLDTEGIRHLQYQVIRDNGHENLIRCQRNPAGRLPLDIHDIPNLFPSGRSPSHPQEIVRSAQELEHRRVGCGEVDGSPCHLSQGIENAPLSEDLVRDFVLKPVFPVFLGDLETVIKCQRNHRPLLTVETQNPDP